MPPRRPPRLIHPIAITSIWLQPFQRNQMAPALDLAVMFRIGEIDSLRGDTKNWSSASVPKRDPRCRAIAPPYQSHAVCLGPLYIGPMDEAGGSLVHLQVQFR